MTIEFQQTNHPWIIADNFTLYQANWTESGIVESLPTQSSAKLNVYKIYIAVAVGMFFSTTLMVIYKIRQVAKNRA